MTSGVRVATECINVFEQIQKLKQHRYAIFRIREEREIDVELIGDRDAEYEDFLDDLKKNGPKECRYALFDYAYFHQCQGASSASLKEKIFLMMWCPSTAPTKDKMLYATSFNALKAQLNGVQRYIQATDAEETSRECVEEQLRVLDHN